MMKGLTALRALALGGALSIGNALAPTMRALTDSLAPISVDRNRGKGKGRSATRSQLGKWRPGFTSSSKARNPNDPAQRLLIDAARAKRARRAEKLQRDTDRAYVYNHAHNLSARLHPFHINRTA